jgi:hypothetical protein
MNQRLKRWESPRKQGRNDKGKGGTARARQLRKREQMLRQKLKDNGTSKPGKLKHEEREITPSLFLWTKLFINPSFSPFPFPFDQSSQINKGVITNNQKL